MQVSIFLCCLQSFSADIDTPEGERLLGLYTDCNRNDAGSGADIDEGLDIIVLDVVQSYKYQFFRFRSWYQDRRVDLKF